MHLFETIDSSAAIGFLFEITLKGTFVLAAAGLAAWLLKSASAAVRHLIWSTALILLLLLPGFVAFTPSYDVAVLPAELGRLRTRNVLDRRSERVSMPLPRVRIGTAERRSEQTEAAAANKLDAWSSPNAPVELDSPPVVRSADSSVAPAHFGWRQALLALWIIGAGLVLIRYVAGWLALRRLRRRTVPVADVGFRLLVKRTAASIGLHRRIRIAWGCRGSMPLTFGCVRPTVLLPEEAREWEPERLLLVLQHELAHIKRRDCLVQAIVYMACTLYWFNPLVWLAATQSHREREMACDDYVLTTGMRGSNYAGHLLDIARSLQGPRLSGLTTIAMARQSELEGRLLAILSPDRRRDKITARGVLATVAILGCLVMSVAALRPVARPATSDQTEPAARGQRIPDREQTPRAASRVDRRKAALPAERARSTSDAAVRSRETTASARSASSYDEQYVAEASAIVERAAATLEKSVNRIMPQKIELKGSVVGKLDSALDLIAEGGVEVVHPDTIPIEQLRRLRAAGVDVEYIEELAAAGLNNLTIDQLVSLAQSDVDAAYVKRLREAGFTDLSADDLVDLGFAGVDADDIAVWAELGYTDLSSRDLIRLAYADVDSSYVRALDEMGFHDLSLSQLIQFGHADVDPQFIRSMRDMGLNDLSPEDLIRLSHAGVDADFIRRMREAGYTDLSADELIRLSHADVDPAYIRRLSEMGLKNLRPGELIRLGQADVDVDFIAEMKSAGYDHLTVPDLVELTQQNVDADYIHELGAAGLTNLSVVDLMKLGRAGVDATFVREMKESGYPNLSVDQLIQLGFAEVDPDYIHRLARAGITSLSPEDLVQLSHADVDADLIVELERAGYKDLSASDLIRLGYAGVDADFISQMASVGLTDLSTSDLVMLAHAGICPDDIRNMQALGMKTSDPSKIVQFKYADIDPDYVERIRKALGQ